MPDLHTHLLHTPRNNGECSTEIDELHRRFHCMLMLLFVIFEMVIQFDFNFGISHEKIVVKLANINLDTNCMRIYSVTLYKFI